MSSITSAEYTDPLDDNGQYPGHRRVPDLGKETELTLTHERFESAKARDEHNMGWKGCLERLARMRAKKLDNGKLAFAYADAANGGATPTGNNVSRNHT